MDENRPDSPDVLLAFVNAHRWTRLNRLREGDGIENEPLLGVWNSAIQVHPYQLEPVLRALQMPRVSLLLADGVGLGKTIQCGLVTEELLLRRRIRRILIICPAMLQRQWKYEMKRKFNLDFEIIDSDSTFQLRRRLGIDTNPWKAYPTDHHVDGLPANARRVAAVPFRHPASAPMPKPMAARWPTPRGIC